MEGASEEPVLAKRLWRIVRIVLYMIRKGISKNRVMVDLHLMMKRGKIAGKKAIGSLVFHHHHNNFSCRTTDAYLSRTHPFYAPKEYEFSCSNSPAFPFIASAASNRRRHHHHHHHHHNYFSCINPTPTDDDDIAVVKKTLEMLDTSASPGSLSPVSVLPEFGRSPMVRQLRITDSPFPIKEVGDDDGKVDKEAEEFIGRFYEQLKLQKRMAALEAMYQEMMLSN